MRYVIGVDLGGTKINCSLSDFKGNIVKQYVIPTEAEKGAETVLNNILSSIERIILDSNIGTDQIDGIGIGSPGPLDAARGIIIEPANIPFNNFKLVKPIENKFKIPVYLDNDANVAAIGEYKFGAGKGAERLIYITVSTGIGGGAILDGKIYRGRTSNALEVGHTTIDLFSTVRCNCGNRGCLEALASGTAIAKRANQAVNSRVETSLRKYDKITSYEVFKEAEAGDKVSLEIRDRAFSYLGVGVTNLISIFDPDMIVIGGGVSKAGEVMFKKIKEVVAERGLKSITNGCRIVPAKLGTDSGVIGAAALAILESGKSSGEGI